MRQYSFLHNVALFYYIKSVFYLLPNRIAKARLKPILNSFSKLSMKEQECISSRVDYYNKLSSPVPTDDPRFLPISVMKPDVVLNGQRSGSRYVFDTLKYTRYFNPGEKANFLFGDITETPDIPTFVKSRPIHGDNTNSIVIPLDMVRHFHFLTDHKKFTAKKNVLIGRAFVAQPHRKRFWEMYFNHPMCDLGNINPNLKDHPEWLKPKISIKKHLDYKFILCIEGNDVASNLKWVMSSNSLAVMPRPTYETWYMEGTLIPNYHYMEIKPDYSDLEERMNYYIAHPEEAEAIISHAHEYVSQFLNRKRERLTALKVLDKYFRLTSSPAKSSSF